MDSFHDTFKAQKRTVDKIAAEYSTTETRVARGYHSMLDKLAVEIYSHAVHFALELIQNADDAKYTRIQHPHVPTLAFEADEDLIGIRCNEDGFTTRDVEALCDIDQSTKNPTNAIGKKGIGFKSVFKVCDFVQIGSEGFQFSFDKTDRPFGMVKPTWRKFPRWLQDQQNTYMHLRLSAGQTFSDIHDELETLEPSVLLFLRNIQEITILTNPSEYRKVLRCHNRGQLYTSITTESWVEDEELESESVEYFMVNHQPNLSGPKVVLAFPCSVEEAIEPQNVHNFLPIRSYGFKFIIQADFQLTSNREALDESSKENRAIRDILPAAFLYAVKLMNESEDERLMWINYLPGPSTLLHFFASTDLFQLLRNKKVLFSRTGQLMKPTDLIHVPPEFRIGGRRPVPLIFNGRHALSTRYDGCDMELLERLDVTQLDVKTFVDALKQVASFGWLNIDWHEDLAKILSKINPNFLSDIPLIPVGTLAGLQWVKPNTLKSSPVYFPEIHGDHNIPDGVNFRFVLAHASANKTRRKLFAKLDVRSLTVTAVCEEIIRTLTNHGTSITLECLIIQTKFLFQHRRASSNQEMAFPKQNIIFGAVVDGRDSSKSVNQHKLFRMAASELYVDDPRQSPFMISQLLGPMPRYYRLHSEYLRQDPKIIMNDWMDWLIGHGISAIPRPVATNDPNKLSPAFECLTSHESPESLCKIALRHWESYKPYLHIITDSLKKRLDRCILPFRDLRLAASELGILSPWDRFLDVNVDENDATDYHLLSRFGLITRASRLFYLEILRYHAGRLSIPPPEAQLLHRIYRCLQSCQDDTPIRAVFKKEKLIAVRVQGASSGHSKWLTADDCFWSPLDCLQFNSGISGQYGNCQKLFRNTLGIPNVATMRHITTDLKDLASQAGTNEIRNTVKPILFRLSLLLRRAKEDQSLFSSDEQIIKAKHDVKRLKIWPITSGQDKPSRLVCSTNFSLDAFLFVPDRADLYELFRDKVPLLDFCPHEVSEIRPLLEWFPGARLLSREVQKKLSYDDKQTRFSMITHDFRRKHQGILRCVRHYLPSLQAEVDGQLHQKLKNVTVYEVEKVDCLQWVHEKPLTSSSLFGFIGGVVPPSGTQSAIETSGDVILQQDRDRFTIYLTQDESLQRKAKCYSIPVLLVSELGLPPDAITVIAPVIELEPSMASTILDARFIARLPEKPTDSLTKKSDMPPLGSTGTSQPGSALSTPMSYGTGFGATGTVSTAAPPQISSTGFIAARSNLSNQSFAFRPRDTSQPVFGGISGSTQQDRSQGVSSRVHLGLHQAPNCQLSTSRASSCPPSNPRAHDNADPEATLTEKLPESLTGSIELQNTIVKHGMATTMLAKDIISDQKGSIIPTSTKMPDKPLLIYPHSTIGFLGELFPAQNWNSVSVTYYIEVKTTIRDAPTPFIMSASQMEHAERWTWNSNTRREQDEINCYLIFRVYRILEDCRHMRIYPDPYQLMQKGVLEKRSRQYAVIPGKPATEDTLIEDEEAESDTEDEDEAFTVGEEMESGDDDGSASANESTSDGERSSQTGDGTDNSSYCFSNLGKAYRIR
ncbi:MAG: hypothetical protein Q9180_001728 [Flavoplaca navasiana]